MRSPSAPERDGSGVGAAVALALAALVAVALPAAADDDADDAAAVGLEIEVGYGGRAGAGDWVPVTVTVQPGRPVAGTLAVEASPGGGGIREERDVEVAVGSRTAYRFVLPRGPVAATLDEGAGDPASVRGQPRDGEGDFVAGVLGPLPASPPPLRSDALGTSGVWVGVDPRWPELSAGALEPLSGLVADGRALANLSDAGLRNVVTAVAAGMDLVVVEPVPDELELPWDLGGQAWTLPAADVADGAADGAVAATVVPAGRGRVATTPARPGEGSLGGSPALWSALIEPRPAVDDTSRAGRPPGATLASVLSGVTEGVPTLPWLAVFLATYIVVVGPVNGVVLARFGRRELAWVTVPAVTVIFTAGGWFGATSSQPPVGFAGSATTWVDGVARDTVVAVVRAPTPGSHELTLPGDDWDVRAEGGGEPAVVRRTDALHSVHELPALQPGGLVARRPADTPPPLRVEADGTAEGLRVTVTNVASDAFSDVSVLAASTSRRVGDLQPGSSQTVTIEGERLPQRARGADGVGIDMVDAPVQGPRALAAVAEATLDGNPGLVWAVGTAPTSATGARIDGRPAEDLGRFVAVAERATGAVRAHTVDRALVSAGPNALRPAPLVVDGGGPVVLRYRLPPSATGAPLRALLEGSAVVPPGQPAPEVWLWERDERQWRPLDEALPDGTGPPDGYVSPLGEVHVRVTGLRSPLQFSGMGLAVEGGR